MPNEPRRYWRHAAFPDLGLFEARFTRHRYDRHTHPHYVIALITAGCEKIRVGRREIVAPAGTIALVNPEEWHDGERGADDGWAYRTFYPTVGLMRAIARDLGRDATPAFTRAQVEDAPLAGALAGAHAASLSEQPTEAEATLLVALRRLVLRHADWTGREEEADRSGAGRRLSVYREIVERALGTRVELKRLADAAGVTRFQVIRDFRRALGVTPAAYIRDRRLRRARALIDAGLPLADAACAAGFADQSHMTRAFHASLAMPPGLYRRA